MMNSTSTTTGTTRTALVTGGSRGIGAATALRLAREGVDVALTYVQDEAAAHEVVAKIRSYGRRGIALRVDSADPEAVPAAVTGAADALGQAGHPGQQRGHRRPRPHRHPHPGRRGPGAGGECAGGVPGLPRGGGADGARWPHRLHRHGAEPARGRSRLHPLRDEQVGAGRTHQAARPRARPARHHGQPGATRSGRHGSQPGRRPVRRFYQRSATALDRFGTTDEVASLVAYLASGEAAYITGTELTVDGGHAA